MYSSNWSAMQATSITTIADQICKCFESLSEFENKLKSSMPEEILSRLEPFNNKDAPNLKDKLKPNPPSTIGLVKEAIPTALVALELLESELSYLLADTKVHVRKTVEVAFAHLQRHIVANKGVEIQTGWTITKNESQLERLAGVHFLLHKIWACKINAQGERTDLVLPEKAVDSDQLNNNAMGIILTEWKKIAQGSKEENEEVNFQHSLVKGAKTQMDLYGGGSLYALELYNYRYIVLVSEKYLNVTQGEYTDPEKDIIYRIVNIACDPETPSKVSKKNGS